MRNHRYFGQLAIRCLGGVVTLFLLRGLPLSVVTLAQGRTLDEGALRVVINGSEVARERFSVTQGGSIGGGLYITGTAFYPPRRTTITLSSVVELGPDSLPRNVQFEATSGDDLRILAQIGSRRLTIRRLSPDGESFIEYPGVARSLVVDDSVFSLYAIPPGTTPGPVRLVAPRQDLRADYELTNLGVQSAMVDGESLQLRHLVLTNAVESRHLWYDELGRLMKVEIPSRRAYAERISLR